jgi:hypothetical protein
MTKRPTRKQICGEVPDGTTSVIESGGGSVGRLRITRSTDRIELSGIQLLPRVQGRGIGTAIIEDLKAEAKAAGIPSISVSRRTTRGRGGSTSDSAACRSRRTSRNTSSDGVPGPLRLASSTEPRSVARARQLSQSQELPRGDHEMCRTAGHQICPVPAP